jgi:hypothetical protein
MNACSEACGQCGACTTADEREPMQSCDWCDRIITEGDTLTVAFGRFCSDDCANKYEADYAAHLQRNSHEPQQSAR